MCFSKTSIKVFKICLILTIQFFVLHIRYIKRVRLHINLITFFLKNLALSNYIVINLILIKIINIDNIYLIKKSTLSGFLLSLFIF